VEQAKASCLAESGRLNRERLCAKHQRDALRNYRIVLDEQDAH
jgi:hypothetical protein